MNWFFQSAAGELGAWWASQSMRQGEVGGWAVEMPFWYLHLLLFSHVHQLWPAILVWNKVAEWIRRRKSEEALPNFWKKVLLSTAFSWRIQSEKRGAVWRAGRQQIGRNSGWAAGVGLQCLYQSLCETERGGWMSLGCVHSSLTVCSTPMTNTESCTRSQSFRLFRLSPVFFLHVPLKIPSVKLTLKRLS